MLGMRYLLKSGGGDDKKEINCVTQTNKNDLTLFQQSPGHLVHVSVSALYYYLVSFPTPTFSSDIEFCGPCHTYDKHTQESLYLVQLLNKINDVITHQ